MRRSVKVKSNPSKSFIEIASIMKEAARNVKPMALSTEAMEAILAYGTDDSSKPDDTSSISTDPLVLKNLIESKIDGLTCTVMSNVGNHSLKTNHPKLNTAMELNFLEHSFVSIIVEEFNKNYNMILFLDDNFFVLFLKKKDGVFIFRLPKVGLCDDLSVMYECSVQEVPVNDIQSYMSVKNLGIYHKTLMAPILIRMDFAGSITNASDLLNSVITSIAQIADSMDKYMSINENSQISIKIDSSLTYYNQIFIKESGSPTDEEFKSIEYIKDCNPLDLMPANNTLPLPPFSYDMIKSQIIDGANYLADVALGIVKPASDTVKILTSKDMMRFVYRVGKDAILPFTGMGLAPSDRDSIVPPDVDPFYKFKEGAPIESYKKFISKDIGRNFFFNSGFFISSDKVKKFAKLMVGEFFDNNGTVNNNLIVINEVGKSSVYLIYKCTFNTPIVSRYDYKYASALQSNYTHYSISEINGMIDDLKPNDSIFFITLNPTASSSSGGSASYCMSKIISACVNIDDSDESKFEKMRVFMLGATPDLNDISKPIYDSASKADIKDYYESIISKNPPFYINAFDDKYKMQSLNSDFIRNVIAPYIASCFDFGGLVSDSIMIKDALYDASDFTKEYLESDLNAGQYNVIISLNFDTSLNSGFENRIFIYNKNLSNLLSIIGHTLHPGFSSYEVDSADDLCGFINGALSHGGTPKELKETQRRFFVFLKIEDDFITGNDFKDAFNSLINCVDFIKMASIVTDKNDGLNIDTKIEDQTVRADQFAISLAAANYDFTSVINLSDYTTLKPDKDSYLSSNGIDEFMKDVDFAYEFESLTGNKSSSIDDSSTLIAGVPDSSIVDVTLTGKKTTPIPTFKSSTYPNAMYSKMIIANTITSINKNVYVVDVLTKYTYVTKYGNKFMDSLIHSIKYCDTNYVVFIRELLTGELAICAAFCVGKDKSDANNNEYFYIKMKYNGDNGTLVSPYGDGGSIINGFDLTYMLNNDFDSNLYMYYGMVSNPLDVMTSIPLILLNKELFNSVFDGTDEGSLTTGYKASPSKLGSIGDIKAYRNLIEKEVMKIVDFNDKPNSVPQYGNSYISNPESFVFPLAKSFFNKYQRYEFSSFKFSLTKILKSEIHLYPFSYVQILSDAVDFTDEMRRKDYELVNFIVIFCKGYTYIYMYTIDSKKEYCWIRIVHSFAMDTFNAVRLKDAYSDDILDNGIEYFLKNTESFSNPIYGYYSAFANNQKETFLYLMSVPIGLSKIMINVHNFGLEVPVLHNIEDTYEISLFNSPLLFEFNNLIPLVNELGAEKMCKLLRQFYNLESLISDKNYLLDNTIKYPKSKYAAMDLLNRPIVSNLAVGKNRAIEIIEELEAPEGIDRKDQAIALILNREVTIRTDSGAALTAPVGASGPSLISVPTSPVIAPVAPSMPPIPVSTISPVVSTSRKMAAKSKTEVYLKKENLDITDSESNNWNALRIKEIQDVMSRSDEIINKYKQEKAGVPVAATSSFGTMFESLDFLVAPPPVAAGSTGSNDKYESVFIHILKQKKTPGTYDSGSLPIAYKADNIAFDYSEFGITDDPRLSSLFNPVVIDLIRTGKPLPLDKLNNVLLPNEHLYDGFKENPSGRARFVNKDRLVSIAKKYLMKSNPTKKDIWKVQIFDAIGLPLDEAFKSKKYRKNPDTLTETQAEMIKLGIDSLLSAFGLTNDTNSLETGFLSVSSSNDIRNKISSMMSTIYGSGGSVRAEFYSSYSGSDSPGIAQFFRYLVLARALGMWSNIIDPGDRTVFRGFVPRSGDSAESFISKLNARNSSVRVSQESKFALNALIQSGLVTDNVTKIDAARIWLRNQCKNILFYRGDINTPFKMSNNPDTIAKILKKAKENKVINEIGGAEITYSMNKPNDNLQLSHSTKKTDLKMSARNVMQRPKEDSRFFGKLPYQSWSANIEANIEGFPVDLFDYAYNDFTFAEWSCMPFAPIAGYTYGVHQATEFLGFRSNTRDPRFVSLPAPNYGASSIEAISMSSSYPYENAVHFVNTNIGIGLPADIISIIDNISADTFSTMEVDLLKNWIAGRPAYPANDPPDGKYLNILLKK